jgi:hypothetical protein
MKGVGNSLNSMLRLLIGQTGPDGPSIWSVGLKTENPKRDKIRDFTGWLRDPAETDGKTHNRFRSTFCFRPLLFLSPVLFSCLSRTCSNTWNLQVFVRELYKLLFLPFSLHVRLLVLPQLKKNVRLLVTATLPADERSFISRVHRKYSLVATAEISDSFIPMCKTIRASGLLTAPW